MIALLALASVIAASSAQDVDAIIGEMLFDGADACRDFVSSNFVVGFEKCRGCDTGDELCVHDFEMDPSRGSFSSEAHVCKRVPSSCRQYLQATSAPTRAPPRTARPGPRPRPTRPSPRATPQPRATSRPRPRPQPTPKPSPSSGGDICNPPSDTPSEFKRRPTGARCSRPTKPYVWNASRKTCTQLRSNAYFCSGTRSKELAAAGIYYRSTLCRSRTRKCSSSSTGSSPSRRPSPARPSPSSSSSCTPSSDCSRSFQSGRRRTGTAAQRSRSCTSSNGRPDRVYYYSDTRKSCRSAYFYGCSSTGRPLSASTVARLYKNNFSSSTACKTKCCA